MTTTTQSNGKTTALVPVAPQQQATASWEPENLDAGIQFAQLICKGQLLPRALQGKPADVLLVLMTGRELGLSPMQSIRNIHVIDGKTLCSADIMTALCKRRRDVCQFFRVVESTGLVATYETQRVGDPQPTRFSFTAEEAKNAGLLGKDNWRKFPAAMLRARCSAALARAVYPDLVAGIYDTDELGHAAAVPVGTVVDAGSAFTDAPAVEPVQVDAAAPAQAEPPPQTAVQKMVEPSAAVQQQAAASTAAPGAASAGDIEADLDELTGAADKKARMLVMKRLVSTYASGTPERARVNEAYEALQKGG